MPIKYPPNENRQTNFTFFGVCVGGGGRAVVPRSSGWLQIHYVTEEDLDLPTTSQMLVL